MAEIMATLVMAPMYVYGYCIYCVHVNNIEI